MSACNDTRCDFAALRRRIAKLAPARQAEYRALLDTAMAMSGEARQKALARLSSRTLRAEALDVRPTMRR